MKEYELTPEQLSRYVAALDAVERYRDLSDEEKERIVKVILERPYMDLRSDWAFKHVFRDMNLLKMLLEDVLPEDILSVEPLSDLEALPNEIDRIRPNDKNIIMDVLVMTNDKREIIIEMQRKNKTSFKNRMLYYGASMLHAQLRAKDSYSRLRPVYVLCFMDYTLKHETDQLMYHYSMREMNSGEVYGNQLSIFLFELNRLKKNALEGLSPVESWLFILKNMGNFAGKPEDMGSRYSAIAEAAQMHDLPDRDKLKYLENMISEEEILDMRLATLEEGREEGLKEGLEEGRKEGKLIAKKELAQAMLNDGMDIALVCKYTGLTPEQLD